MTTATITQPVTAETQIPVDTLLSLVKIIEDFVEAEQMFTCWDVTKRLTSQGFKVFHNQVRDFVHGLKVNGSAVLDAWDRNTHTFYLRAASAGGTNPMTAEVYAPSWLDLKDYDPYAVSDSSTPGIKPGLTRSPVNRVIIPSTTQKDTGSTITPGIPAVVKSVQKRIAAQTVAAKVNKPANRTSRDARGRLCIPNAMVRKMGLHTGDIAYIHKAVFGLTLRATTLPGQKYLTSLKVDKDDNVRITRKALDKAGVSRSTSSMVVSIDSFGTSVIITR